MKRNLVVFLLALFAGIASVSAQNSESLVLISTEYGDMTFKLYNETPLHRDNFIKLAREGWYEGSIFHRVIKNFMIQGGHDVNGKEDPGYTVPAEFLKLKYHKKGALAAARLGDGVNPEKASSGCQFYVVQGRTFTDADLDMFTKQFGREYTPEMREIYKTIGGTPHLDGSYTVFGEMLTGYDVLDKIASVTTARGDRPLKDIKMTVKVLE